MSRARNLDYWIGVTDEDWFNFHKSHKQEEINFWKPSGDAFSALPEGGLFLFKLRSPKNFVVGGGYYVRNIRLSVSMAWLAFKEMNGAATETEFANSIRGYRRYKGLEEERDPVIGCAILTEPFFWEEKDWIPCDPEEIGLYGPGRVMKQESQVAQRILAQYKEREIATHVELVRAGQETIQNPDEDKLRYGNPAMYRPRLGQVAFRLKVMDAYERRCALTGEKTLPVLEAAHIKPYAEFGPHAVMNGIFMRSDLHILFDRKYLTIHPDHRIEVSKRIKAEYENGKEYYKLDGQKLAFLPPDQEMRPSEEFLKWHNADFHIG